MEIIPTDIPDLLILQPKVHKDHRGFFLESFNLRVMEEAGLNYAFVQDNHARSEEIGVLRGLHFQLAPATQTKLVWVTSGAVFDVVADLRVGSPTFGKTFSIELSADNFTRLLVPKGFAHGYMTIQPGTEFMYKVDAFYAPDLDAGIAYNDPDLGIKWPDITPILSDKDKTLPRLKDFDSPFTYK